MKEENAAAPWSVVFRTCVARTALLHKNDTEIHIFLYRGVDFDLTLWVLCKGQMEGNLVPGRYGNCGL